MKPITADAAYTRAAALCSRSEHAVSDIMTKLQTWGLPTGIAREVIDRLVRDNFIDEARYARAFVHDKHAYNGWGRIKIAYQLRAKGIAQHLIDEAMNNIDDIAYAQMLDKLLASKWREVNAREPQLARAAMLRFAAGRGYEPSMVYDAVDKVMKDGACD